MQFKNIKSLLAWAFQIECSAGIKIATYGEQTGAGFGAMSMEDQRYQAAMVLAKVGRLCVEERAALWALHLQRDTEMIYLAGVIGGRFGLTTNQALIRKWATGCGVPTCRQVAALHGVGRTSANEYEQKYVMQLELLATRAYAAIEDQCMELLEWSDELTLIPA